MDGGVLTAQRSINSSSSVPVLSLTKFSSTGNVQWYKCHDIGQNTFRNIVQTPDSGYFMCYSDPSSISNEYKVIRFNVLGDTIFTRRYSVGVNMWLMESPVVVARNNGGYYVTGNIMDTVNSTFNWHVFALDATGNLQWSNVYNTDVNKSFSFDIDTCSNGDIILLGRQFLGSTHTPALTRIDASGNLIWSMSYTSAITEFFPKSLVVLPNDDFMIVGSSLFSSSAVQCIKTNSQGNFQWMNNYVLGNSPSPAPLDAHLLNSNEIAIVGSLGLSNGFFVKINTNGQFLCAKSYPGIDITSIDVQNTTTCSMVGFDYLTSQSFVLTTDYCGHGCSDTTLQVFSSPFTIGEAVFNGVYVLPMQQYNHTITAINNSQTVSLVCTNSTDGLEENPSFQTPVLFPVPANDELFVRSAAAMVQIEIYNSLGQCIYIQRYEDSRYDCNIGIAELNEGNYFLRIYTPSGILNKSFIVCR